MVCTQFVVEIDTVNQFETVSIDVLDREEVIFMKLLVSTVEILGNTSKSTLHQLLNASILGHVDVGLWARKGVQTVVIRSEESMTHFMCNQKVEDNFFSIPDRESQNTLLHIKGSGRNCPVLNNKVFRCEEFGESAFDFLYGHAFRVYAYIIHTQRTPDRGRVPLY